MNETYKKHSLHKLLIHLFQIISRTESFKFTIAYICEAFTQRCKQAVPLLYIILKNNRM